MSSFLNSERQDPKLARAIRRLRTPHLSDWSSILNAFVKRTRPEGDVDALTRDLCGAWASFRAESTLTSEGVEMPTDDAIRRIRNRLAHERPPEDAELADAIARVESGLKRALEAFGPVLGACVIYCLSESGAVQVMTGHEASAAAPTTRRRSPPVVEPRAELMALMDARGGGGRRGSFGANSVRARATAMTLDRLEALSPTRFRPETYQRRTAATAGPAFLLKQMGVEVGRKDG